MSLLAAHGIIIRWQSVEYTLRAMALVLPKSFLLGVCLYCYYDYARGGQLRAYLRQVVTPSWLVLWLRLWLAVWLVSFSYFWFKVCVPLINHRVWDEVLWHIDTVVHFGYSPNVVLVEFLEGSVLVSLLDRWYALWFASIVWSLSFFAAATDDTLRRRIVLSCILAWSFGLVLYTAFPTLGPTYVFGNNWDALKGTMPLAEQTQERLMANYQSVLEGRSGVLGQFDHTRGVAAMPSLHVAFHWLFALWARRYVRPLFLPFVAMTCLTFVGSVLTGWHYAVDGYVGVALAYVCFRLACRLERPDHATDANGDQEDGV